MGTVFEVQDDANALSHICDGVPPLYELISAFSKFKLFRIYYFMIKKTNQLVIDEIKEVRLNLGHQQYIGLIMKYVAVTSICRVPPHSRYLHDIDRVHSCNITR